MTPAQAMDIGSKLIKLLSQQQFLYRQLRELARKQGELVSNDNPEMLLRILAGRQRLIDRLTALDNELGPIRADWEAVAESLPAEQRDQAQQLVADVQAILSEIIACDQRDTETLQQKKQEVAAEIRTTAVGQRVNRAYGNPASAQSKYFDTGSK